MIDYNSRNSYELLHLSNISGFKGYIPTWFEGSHHRRRVTIVSSYLYPQTRDEHGSLSVHRHNESESPLPIINTLCLTSMIDRVDDKDNDNDKYD